MKFCPQSGNKITNHAQFCDKCGKPINNSRKHPVHAKPATNHKNLYFSLVIIALVVVIGAGVYLFTSGATNQVSNKQPSATTHRANHQTSSSKQQTTKTNSTKSNANNNQPIWDSSKNTKLNNFMESFGNQMNQDYDYFNPANQDNYMGYHFPADLEKGNIRVNGRPVSIGWSDNGNGNNDYNVVAIYSDVDSDRNKVNMIPHLYLFTIHDGQPVALVTQQNQGNPENAIYFKPTANQDVKNQFANIVNHNEMSY